MRETVQELRLSLPKGTPLGFKAALCAGTFDCPSDGRPARGEAAEAALELVERAVPNAVLLDTFAAEACGPRIDRRPSPDRRSFEVMGARPPPIAPLSRPVGRDSELREIEAALAGLSSGGVQAPLFILGAAGCGKSSLASELFNRAPDALLRAFIAYPGGTTTAEALWMGVPVLTLAGERFLSRQGVGLLMNAGLPEWVANNPEDYLARAIDHASDLPRLAALRERLRAQVLASPVFDADRFAGHFEDALRSMWTTWCAQQRRQ